ncbi:predicted protein [Histoplasma mississippiense (nom. inval.)]|uniref:predicted protein n=1 Tax=Ajellomyces capsulatus (strain NAm1 / WU24) TaxID=2059318 RepID=UPI000157C97B|nr:predicted protein [Histoplasma mississippiense (nom. inval.)]EDN09679.1 predicted protein [Histoplasma mississippiense (nom. inval.)]
MMPITKQYSDNEQSDADNLLTELNQAKLKLQGFKADQDTKVQCLAADAEYHCAMMQKYKLKYE